MSNKEELIQKINELIESLGLDYDTYESLMISIIKLIDDSPE